MITTINAQLFVQAHLYPNEEAVIQDALRLLLRQRNDLRLKLVLYRYETEGLSLAKAAHLAGVSWAQMKEIMLEYGVQPQLGCETMEEAAEEIATLRQFFTPSP
jgi:predicted HTH domain antitoxin